MGIMNMTMMKNIAFFVELRDMVIAVEVHTETMNTEAAPTSAFIVGSRDLEIVAGVHTANTKNSSKSRYEKTKL